MMCNEMAQSPGTVAWFDAATGENYEWMKAPNITNFNPHGCGWREGWGLLATDYVQPTTLFASPPKVDFRDTVRFFNVDGTLNATIVQPGTQNDGMMDVRWIPNDPLGRAITSGTSGNLVYLIHPAQGVSEIVYDLGSLVNGITGLSSGYSPISADGLRIVMTFSMRFVVLCNLTDPAKPTTLDLFDFCNPPPGSGAPDFSVECDASNNSVGTHYIIFFGDFRVVCVNYFLILGNFNFAGTGSVHAFKLDSSRTKLIYDADFDLDGSGRLDFMEHPHSVQAASFDVTPPPKPPSPPPPSTGASATILPNLLVLMMVLLKLVQ
jgi:hypothetical protein